MISTNPIGEAAGETVRNIIHGDRPGRPSRRGHQHNLGDTERNLSIAAGAAIGLIGLMKSRGLVRLAALALAGALLNRGVSGYCALYEKLGVDSRHR